MTELDWDTTVSRIYREVVADSAAEGIDRQVAYDTAVARLVRMIRSGALDLPMDVAVRAALDRADDRDARRADSVLRRIAAGETSLLTEVGDPLLDVIVKLGGGRRKAWRDVTAEDLQVMTELRAKNARIVVESFSQWREDAATVLLGLGGQHESLGAAVEAGVFTPVHERAS